MRINELKQKKADLANEARALIDSVGDEDFTGEQQIHYARLKADIEKTQNRLDLAVDKVELERTALEAGADQRVARAGGIKVRARYEDDKSLGGFADHKDFFRAVVDAGRGRELDERLSRYKAAAGSDEQGVYSPTYGGFLVPVGMADGVLNIAGEADILAPFTTKIPMGTPKLSINARVDKDHSTSVSGGLTVSRKDETSAAASSRMAFEQIELNAHALFGLTYASEEILTDSPQSFAALLSNGYKDEFASNAMDERLNGSGVGEFLGVLSANNDAKVSVAKVVGQTAATIVTENVDAMAARCWRYPEAIWLANQTTRPQLRALSRVIGTGGAVVSYFEQSDGQERLDGRPIFFTEHAATLGTVGDLILGVWSQYLEGSYQPMQQAESIHVRFVEHERAFKFWLRNDSAPWWSSVLTPKNGDTLAPFVTLATRA